MHLLAQYLHDLILNNISTADSYISDSFQLVDKLRRLHLKDNYILVPLNVVSLFTNVPIDLAINNISVRWTHMANKCNILKKEFIDAHIQLILFTLNLTRNSTNKISEHL